jgi:hypothetical protein
MEMEIATFVRIHSLKLVISTIGIIISNIDLLNYYSTYCSFSTCKVCLYKTRPYPMKNLGHGKRGDICKVCDRKFFVREMIIDSTITIENNQ